MDYPQDYPCQMPSHEFCLHDMDQSMHPDDAAEINKRLHLEAYPHMEAIMGSWEPNRHAKMAAGLVS